MTRRFSIAAAIVFCVAAWCYSQPSLFITQSNQQVTVSWPVATPEFALQASTNILTGSNWTSITTNIITDNGTNYFLANSSAQIALFFRLSGPCPSNDLPDALFIDENCDGIDGDVSDAIFVSGAGVDSTSAGSRQSPVKTINFAIQRALALGKTQVLIQSGTYTESVNLANGIGVYGGYDVSWTRGPRTQPGHTVTIQGSYNTIEQQFIAIRSAVNQTNVIADLVIVGPNATNHLSSYAVYVRQSELRLDRVSISGGPGGTGLAGTNGLDATLTEIQLYMNGGKGGNAAEFETACDNTSRGVGGSFGTNGFSTRGGSGGAGGTMDTDCSFPTFDHRARPGLAGGDAQIKVGLQGAGGAGGDVNRSQPGIGQNGTITNGAGGLSGDGYQLVGHFFQTHTGGSGSLGQNGGGGGGGGGSGGNDEQTDSYGAGGGGGGAGGLAARSGGGGGGGGGSSFCVFGISSSITVGESSFTLGAGGNGGIGGTGGRGQSGGNGGLGGSPAGTAAGGAGGKGGHGGHGGGGGGGQGGYSAGIASYNSSITTNGVVFAGGAAGGGGQGGVSAPSAPAGETDGIPGQTGTVGVKANILSMSLSVP